MQGSKARAPGFGSRGIGPPRADPRQIDSDSRDDVLQARLGQADVATLPQVAPADRLTMGSLDAGPSGIVQAERRGALPFAGGLQCLLIVLCLQPDDARLALVQRGRSGHGVQSRRENRASNTMPFFG